MASVKSYKTAKGKAWRVQYRSPDGKSRTKQGFRTKNEAQAWADKNAVAMHEQDWINPNAGKATVTEVWDRWSRARTVKASTQSLDLSTWNVHVKPMWGTRSVNSIRKTEVQAWIAGMDGGPSVARRAYALLRQVLGFAVDDGSLKNNPCIGVSLPRKTEPRHCYLTPPQLWALVNEVTVHRELVALLGTVGLRWGEAAGLQIGDVDFFRRRIHVRRNAVTVGGKIVVGTPKTYEERTVTVPQTVMEMLEPLTRGRRKDDWLFTARDGGPLRKPTGRHFLRTAHERLMKRGVDIPYVSAHDLRHVAAGLMVNAGANVLQVSRQLGHAKPSITLDVYSDLFEDGLDALGVQVDGLLSGVVELSWNGSEN